MSTQSDRVVEAVKKILGPGWVIKIIPDECVVYAEPDGTGGMYARRAVTFAMLEALSLELGTENINLDYNSGWSGTEVTPGDPGHLGIFCRDVKAAIR